jgi:cyclohexadienyl dehydratase
LEIVRFRWPQLRQDVEAEKFDIAMSGITMWPERLFFAAFSYPYAAGGAVVLMADTGRFPSITTINQAGVRLAVNAGGHLEQVARAQFEKATLLPIRKNMDLPVLVETQQAEALLTDTFEAPQFLARHGRLSALPAFGRDRKAYLLRRSDEQLQDWLNNWLLDREGDGFLPGLRQRWLGGDHARPLAPLSPVFALLDLRRRRLLSSMPPLWRESTG